MKKFLRNAVIVATLLGAAFGAVSSADAFIYGLYNNTAPGEITQLGDGIKLCYEHQCNSVFVDENSAYIVSQDGPRYTLEANIIYHNFDNGSEFIETARYVYDTAAHKMYVVAKNGKLYPQNRPTQESCGAEMRGGAKALQIWHAVMGTDW